MTAVDVEVREGGEYLISIQGHAAGDPELCTAVSAIAQSVMILLMNHPPVQWIERRCEPGDVLLHFAEPGEFVSGAVHVLIAGALSLQRDHDIQVHIKAGRD